MSRKSKTLTIEELREKHQEITKQLEVAEQAERAEIGKAVQKLTGLMTWADINANWQLILRGSGHNDEPFSIKDPFHPAEVEAVK